MTPIDSGRSTPPSPNLMPWKSYWKLDPSITFLNHGSFGACPTPVLEQQQRWRAQMEAEPVRFFALELEPLLDAARQTLGDFVGAPPADLAFVPNATTGVNTVLQSLPLQPGDELLTTNHEYNASRNALDVAAARRGAIVVVAEIPFPLDQPEQAIEPLLAQVSDRTRLVLIDHVTSQTGFVFPLAPLIAKLTAQGIDVLVDGAHAPGMIPLNLKELGATFYTGNCHKWMCAPKGAAFLYVHPDRQATLRPLVISHGANSSRSDRSRFRLEFDWVGTSDPTAYLSVPTAIQFMGHLLPGGWADVQRHNRQLVLAARQQLCDRLTVSPPCPDSMIGSMAVVPLPPGSASDLQTRLFQDSHIEIPVIPWANQRLLRLSAQLYNTAADYEHLGDVLQRHLAAEAHSGREPSGGHPW